MEDKSLRDEAAELVTEAVRELRDSEVAEAVRELRAEVEKLRAERESHSCHGCHCGHVCIHYNTWPGTWTPTYSPPYYVTWGGTPTVTTTNTSGYVNTASGYNPAITSSFTN